MITTSTLEKTLRKHTKKTGTVKVKSTNCEAKKIFRKLSIDDRLKKMQENEAFITIKDHEEGFSHHVSCRLLNPSKINIGKISKVLLDQIMSAVLSSTKIDQWKTTSSVIKLLEKITHEQISSLICFDADHFYPFISSNLFKESTEFARQFIQISDDLSIIIQARKTFLYEGTAPWIKKSGDEDLDVPMGCFDGAEICEVVRT